MAKILICEDYIDLLEFFLMLLKSNGHEVIGASSKRQLLFQLESFTPDLLLLDVILHDGNGRDICEAIRATDDKVAIILISVNPKMLAEFEKCGASAVIEKPFNIEDVLNTVNRLLVKEDIQNKI